MLCSAEPKSDTSIDARATVRTSSMYGGCELASSVTSRQPGRCRMSRSVKSETASASLCSRRPLGPVERTHTTVGAAGGGATASSVAAAGRGAIALSRASFRKETSCARPKTPAPWRSHGGGRGGDAAVTRRPRGGDAAITDDGAPAADRIHPSGSRVLTGGKGTHPYRDSRRAGGASPQQHPSKQNGANEARTTFSPVTSPDQSDSISSNARAPLGSPRRCRPAGITSVTLRRLPSLSVRPCTNVAQKVSIVHQMWPYTHGIAAPSP